MKKYLIFFLFFGISLYANNCAYNPVPVPEPTPDAISFYESGNALWIIQFIWSLVVPGLLLFTGFSAKLRSFCNRRTSIWFWQVGLFALILLLVVALLNLPLDFYSNYLRPHSYEMSNMSLGRWFEHFLIGTAIATILGVILVWILYAIIKKSPKRWWLYFGLLTFPLGVFLVIIQPIWIAPLFNKFEPMKDSELKGKIMELAERSGIGESRIFVVDMSEDTKAMNAYVTGIGTSKRIVIWDTTLKGLDNNEILFVVGHEIGHYVLHHLWWGLLANTVTSVVILYIVYLISCWMLKRLPRRVGIMELRDVASLPLILLVYAFASTVLSPITNLYSQSIEHDADIYGLELTQLNHAAAIGFVKLQYNNLGYPWPGEFYMLFRTGHPSIGARITFFNKYKPWCEGKPIKYKRYIRSDNFLPLPPPGEAPIELNEHRH